MADDKNCTNGCGCQDAANGVIQMGSSSIVLCSPVNFAVANDCLPRLYINNIPIAFKGDLASFAPENGQTEVDIIFIIPTNQSTCDGSGFEIVSLNGNGISIINDKASILLCGTHTVITSSSVQLKRSDYEVEIRVQFVLSPNAVKQAYGRFQLVLPRFEIGRVTINNLLALNCSRIKSEILIGGAVIDDATARTQLIDLIQNNPDEYKARYYSYSRVQLV